MHARGEGRLLPLVLDALDLDVDDVLRRADQGGGDDQARDLVAGVEGVVDGARRMDAGARGVVREDGGDDGLGDAALAQDRGALGGMVGEVGVDLPVEVVEQAGERPVVLFIRRELPSVMPHGGFDGDHVPAEAGVLDVFVDDGEGGGSVHGWRDYITGMTRTIAIVLATAWLVAATSAVGGPVEDLLAGKFAWTASAP